MRILRLFLVPLVLLLGTTSASALTILGDGVKGIKKQAIAAYDAREAAAGNVPVTSDKDDDDDD